MSWVQLEETPVTPGMECMASDWVGQTLTRDGKGDFFDLLS